MVNVALYARCSTKKQELDGQINDLVAWAKKNNYTYIIYQDFAVSGKKDSRQGINQMLEDAKNKKFDKLAIFELSRIGRSMAFIHSTIETLSKQGIPFVTTKDGKEFDYNNDNDRYLFALFAVAADIEHKLITERNARGRLVIKERGIKVGRKQAELSMKAMLSLKAQGMSIRKIAKEFNVNPATVSRRLKIEQLSSDAESSAKDMLTETKPSDLSNSVAENKKTEMN